MKVIANNDFFINADEYLSEGKSVELRCLGSSMQPYLRGDGSEVIIASPFEPEELTPGAIVLFRHLGTHKCHRIIRRNNNNLLIQGDGVIRNYEQAAVSDVCGIIRTIIRRNKKPVSTRSKTARFYWFCWRNLSPVRRYLLFGYRLGVRLVRRDA